MKSDRFPRANHTIIDKVEMLRERQCHVAGSITAIKPKKVQIG
jgi:hypothetical protein